MKKIVKEGQKFDRREISDDDARVELAAGEEAQVRFEVPAARLAFTGRSGDRIVEPGDVELQVQLRSWSRRSAKPAAGS